MVSSGEVLKRLDGAIAALPVRLREPLILTLFEDFSHREAGEFLGVSEKAVETRVYRAKQSLSRVLERIDLQDFAEDSDS